MTNFDKNISRGKTLMSEALEKYTNGDFEMAEKCRKMANECFDRANNLINTEDGVKAQLYGESRNFGIIYNVFEQNVDKLLEDTKKQKAIKEFYDTIKNNKVLNEQFRIYDALEKPNNVTNVDGYVNEATSLFTNKFNSKQIKESNEKLISLFKKYSLDEYVTIPEDTENLYEAIEYIMLNKKSMGNINEFVNAEATIRDYVKAHASLNEKKSGKEIFNDFMKQLDKKQDELEENLTKEEKQLIEAYLDKNTDKKQFFENYKRQTLDNIKKAINESDDEEKGEWLNVYETVSKKQFDPENGLSLCAEMLEMNETFNK